MAPRHVVAAPFFDLSVASDEHGSVRVEPRGELDLASAGRLEACLDELSSSGKTVIVDLRGLTFMDSTGVRLLLQTADAARRDGWALRMVPPAGGEALMTLQETGVDALLPLEAQAPPGAGA